MKHNKIGLGDGGMRSKQCGAPEGKPGGKRYFTCRLMLRIADAASAMGAVRLIKAGKRTVGLLLRLPRLAWVRNYSAQLA